jgi:hypothetical protein
VSSFDCEAKDEIAAEDAERLDLVRSAIQGDLEQALGNPRMIAFLVCFAATRSITEACKQAGCSRDAHYKWMRYDDAYRDAFERTKEISNDLISTEMWNRAIRGWREPIIHKGMVMGYTLKKSDDLLMMIARGAMPDIYSKRVEVSGNIRHNVVVSQVTNDMLGLEGEALLTAMKKRISEMKLGVATDDDAPQNRPGLMTLPGSKEGETNG